MEDQIGIIVVLSICIGLLLGIAAGIKLRDCLTDHVKMKTAQASMRRRGRSFKGFHFFFDNMRIEWILFLLFMNPFVPQNMFLLPFKYRKFSSRVSWTCSEVI